MTQSETSNSNWSGLYKIGGVAALIFLIYSLVTMIIFLGIGVLPETALDAFNLLQENKLVGLLRLDSLTLLIVPFYYPIFLSIYVAIRRDNLAYATLSALLAFAGVTLFLATPSVFPLVSLSDKFAAATTDAQRQQILTVGEALISSDMWHSSGAKIGGVLMLIAALTFSIVMLKSEDFGKGTAYVGIISHGLDLVRIFVGLFIPQVGASIMAVAGTLYLVWFPLLARDFFRLGRSKTKG
jgi:hypothetical protein